MSKESEKLSSHIYEMTGFLLEGYEDMTEIEIEELITEINLLKNEREILSTSKVHFIVDETRNQET